MAITLGAQPFPDTEALMRAVAQHQKDIEAFGNVRHFEGYIEQRKAITRCGCRATGSTSLTGGSCSKDSGSAS